MVKIDYTYYDNNDVYSDGNIELELLEHYQNGKSLDNTREDIFFSTTDIRENIINWYPFSNNSNVLEIGAGLGTITSFLCNKCKSVTAVEGSKKRAQVIASRHKDCNNLNIICGNFNDIKFTQKYDYIILVGVFEYSKIFCNTDNPFEDFMNNIKELLNKNGRILVAIENQFGIKYWAGLCEDHLRTPYKGLEGYSDDIGVKTFGKNELTKLFDKIGFKSIKYYYPYPDYKLPDVIFTDEHLPKLNEIQKLQIYNYYDDKYNFSVNNVLKEIARNDNFPFFANSFLVELSLQKNNLCNVDFVKYQNNRNAEYETITYISNQNVYKIPKSFKSKRHVDNIRENHRLLNQFGIKCCEIYDDYSIEYISGKTIIEEIISLYQLKEYDKINALIDNFIKYLYANSREEAITNPFVEDIRKMGNEINVLPLGLFDLHFDNVIVNDNCYVLIDQEFTTSKQLPIEYNIYISLNVLFDRFPQINTISSIYDYYNKYNIDSTQVDIFEKCRDYYFNHEIKLFDNYKQVVYNKKAKVIIKNNNLEKELNEVINNNKKEIEELNTNLLIHKQTINNLEEELHLKEEQINELNVSISNCKKQIEESNNNLINISNEMNLYKNEFHNVINSKSWKITQPLRFLSAIKNSTLWGVKRIIVYISKFAYKYFPLPKSVKYKALNELCERFSAIKRIRDCYHNINSYSVIPINDVGYVYGTELQSINKKIAIHVHLYYLDLLPEFIKYLNNMPFEFDAYFSVPQQKFRDKIIRETKKIKNIDKIVVEVCENVGRDISPMLVQFGERIQKYDYICHIHTKKSIRTGAEQDGWRTHLLESVLGSESIIRNIFYQFENNDNIGLIYPETYDDMPYWAHTLLGNSDKCYNLSIKFHVGLSDTYFDYPVGSFFWAKTDAIDKLLKLKLKYKDFGIEEGKNDGTLAHAIERMIPFAVMSKGYSYLVFDRKNLTFATTGKKCLWQYCVQNKDNVIDKLSKYNIITFDIFDTLISRKVYTPDSIFDILEKQIEKEYGFKDFKKIRKDSEFDLRVESNFKNDVSISQIYDRIAKILNISRTEASVLEDMEKNYEIEYCIPRNEMLDIYNTLKKKHKKIILISDMYLDSDTIKKMLNKCGYSGWNELLISCETNKRKDTGQIWDYFYKKYDNSIHCGDNEHSDIQMVCDLGHDYVHVMQPKKIFELTEYGKYLMNNVSLSDADNIILGCIVNKTVFNNPFRKDFYKIVDNYHDYGYTFLGPLFLKFFLWLEERIIEHNNDMLLFLAREGYYFEKIYEKYCKMRQQKPIRHKYFLASRRSVSVAAFKNKKDISMIFERYYKGNVKNLFKTRIGYEIDIDDFEIELPRDKEIVMKLFDNIKESYFKNIKPEQQGYKAYAKKAISGCKNPAVIDLGYSGTIQYYLSKVVGKKISGYYFITDVNVLPEKIGCKVDRCFNSLNQNTYEKQLLNNSLILESFLTAPYGQLINIIDGLPNYKDDIMTKDHQNKLDAVFKGVIDFMEDVLSTNNNIKSDDINTTMICKNYYSLVQVDNILDKDIEQEFILDDKYCMDEVSNVFELLKSRRGNKS